MESFWQLFQWKCPLGEDLDPGLLGKQELQLIRADDVEEGDIVEGLMAVVPGIQRAVLRVVVQHGDVGIFVLEGDVNVLVGRGVGLVSIVNLGSPRVAVGDIEGPADDEGLTGAALGVAGVPCLQDLQ